MVSTTTYGRVRVDKGPSSLSWSGDVLTVRQIFKPATLVEAKQIREQWIGLVGNPDEPVIPVTSTSDPQIDGFYIPVGAECEIDRTFLTTNLMQASIGLRRIANGFQNPVIETYVMSRLATNAHGVLATTDYAVIAATRAADNDLVDLVASFGVYDITAASQGITAVDGSSVRVTTIGDTNIAGSWTRYGVPGTYYSPPACTIEYQVGGVWFAAVNRNIPAGVPWRMNNGIVRIGADAWPSTQDLRLEVADSSAWVGRYINGHDGAGGALEIGGIAGPFILRNSPETAVVKVITRYGYATFTIWSGGTIVMITLTTEGQDVGLLPVVTEAGTNVTGGIRTTANDANGNRLVFLSREAVTTSTGTTQISGPAGGDEITVFAAGFNLGAAATGLFSEAGMLGQLCAPPQWVQRVAAR